MRGFILGIVFTLVVLIGGGYFLLEKGYVSFQADQPPMPMEKKIAMGAVDASTERNAPDTKNPVTASDENIVEGAKLYLTHCAGCHGIPSNTDSQFGRSFYPVVPPFFKEAPDMPENQNFYIIQHGIRWTGMPAWNKTLSDAQIWQIVTFLSHVEKLPPAAQKEFEPLAGALPAPR